MRTFEVHVWVENRTGDKQYTGTMHELIVMAEGSEHAKLLACKGFYRAQVRKCEEQFVSRALTLRSWKTVD